MHSVLAGGPHFLAHNLLLPFPSCSSWGGVLPWLLYPSTSLWYSQSKSGPGCLFFVFVLSSFFCFKVFFQSYQDDTTFSGFGIMLFCLQDFKSCYEMDSFQFWLRDFECRNIKIIFHSADEKISSLMYLHFNTLQNYCGIGLQEDCSAASLQDCLNCFPNPTIVDNNTGGGTCARWHSDVEISVLTQTHETRDGPTKKEAEGASREEESSHFSL